MSWATLTHGCSCTHEAIICSEPKIQLHSFKLSLASYSQSTPFLTFRSIWGSQKWSQVIPQTPKHRVWYQHQVHSMLNLLLHSRKLSLASYSPSSLFLTFRSISGSRKWFQMIPSTKKTGVRHQNEVSSMARSKVTIIWHSISLDWLNLQQGDFDEKSENFKWPALGQILSEMSQIFCQWLILS